MEHLRAIALSFFLAGVLLLGSGVRLYFVYHLFSGNQTSSQTSFYRSSSDAGVNTHFLALVKAKKRTRMDFIGDLVENRLPDFASLVQTHFVLMTPDALTSVTLDPPEPFPS